MTGKATVEFEDRPEGGSHAGRDTWWPAALQNRGGERWGQRGGSSRSWGWRGTRAGSRAGWPRGPPLSLSWGSWEPCRLLSGGGHKCDFFSRQRSEWGTDGRSRARSCQPRRKVLRTNPNPRRADRAWAKEGDRDRRSGRWDSGSLSKGLWPRQIGGRREGRESRSTTVWASATGRESLSLTGSGKTPC